MTQQSTNTPSHIAYHVREGGTDKNGHPKNYWTRIGAAWQHDDQKGVTVELEVLPMPEGGKVKVVLRTPKETPDGQTA